MQPYQVRVVEEREALRTKIAALTHFIGGEALTFSRLPDAEQDRLRRQLTAMSAYRDVLDERISAF